MGRKATYHERLDRVGVPSVALGGRRMGYDERIEWLVRRAMSSGAKTAQADWLPPGEHFVVITERDSQNERRYVCDVFGIPHLDCEVHQPIGPITGEHYIGENTHRDAITMRANCLRMQYGRVAIAKLVIVEADK